MLSALREFVPVAQMLLGGDYRYLPPPQTIAGLEAYGFSATELIAINRGNALALMPGIKT